MGSVSGNEPQRSHLEKLEPKTTVAIVNFRSADLLSPLLDSIPADAEIVVVDNFSSDDELAKLTVVVGDRGRIIRRVNDGFAGGVNAAVREIAPDRWIVLANPDARFDPGSLRELVRGAAADALDLASPVILRPDGTVWFSGGHVRRATQEVVHVGFGLPRPTKSPTSTEFVSGCVMAISPRARRLMPLRSDLFMYYEDVDLSRRALTSGLQLGIVAGATAHHIEGGSSKARGDTRSSLNYYYQERNRYLLSTEAIGPVLAALVAPLAVARVALRILKSESSPRVKLSALLIGSFDGARGRTGNSPRNLDRSVAQVAP
jgi:GT2 family glycosyltransferase